MRTKLTVGESFSFFKDNVTGLVFAGGGPFLYEDNFSIMFQPTVAPALVEELTVEKGVFVTFYWCDHEHNFYVEQPEEIPKLLKALCPGRESSIVVTPDYYDYLMSVKHQAYLDSWTRSPGQGCL